MIEMLTCRICLKAKPKGEFNRRRRSKTGHQPECRSCASERLKVWYQNLSSEDLIAKREYQRVHRKSNPEPYLAHRLKYLYNITKDEFESFLNKQNGVCAICSTDKAGGRYNQWSVDHDHKCCPGVRSCGLCIRGLLCNSCNHGLGNFKDDIKALRNAIEYLEKPSIKHD